MTRRIQRKQKVAAQSDNDLPEAVLDTQDLRPNDGVDEIALSRKIVAPNSGNALLHGLQQLQQTISAIIALGALVAASGYMVFNAHISGYTGSLAFTPRSETYVTAGMWMLLIYMSSLVLGRFVVYAIELVSKRVVPKASGHWQLLAQLIILIACVFGFVSIYGIGFIFITLVFLLGYILVDFLFAIIFLASGLDFGDKYPSIWNRFVTVMLEPERALSILIKHPFNVASVYLIIVVAIVALIATSLFAKAAYIHIPIWIGGGAPTVVRLVAQEDVHWAMYGLDSAASNASKVSPPLCLIANLHDGALVFEPTDNQVAEIKLDVLSAIRPDPTFLVCTPPR
jgi:hypothetical protein